MDNLPQWHYYESHVTIEPVFDDRLDKFKEIAKFHKFNVAELLMKKKTGDSLQPSRMDSFCTSRNGNKGKLIARTILLVQDLQMQGFKVYRYKIESTLLDSRYEDKFKLL